MTSRVPALGGFSPRSVAEFNCNHSRLDGRERMRASRWMCVFAAVLIGFSLATAGAKAQGRGHDDDEKGHGHGKGHNKERKEERKEERQERKVQYRYSQHDHDEMRGWYSDHENNL